MTKWYMTVQKGTWKRYRGRPRTYNKPCIMLTAETTLTLQEGIEHSQLIDGLTLQEEQIIFIKPLCLNIHENPTTLAQFDRTCLQMFLPLTAELPHLYFFNPCDFYSPSISPDFKGFRFSSFTIPEIDLFSHPCSTHIYMFD